MTVVKPTLSQTERILTATTPPGADGWVLTDLSGSEYLSQPFEFELTFLSERSDINFKRLLGSPVGFTIKQFAALQPNLDFHGVITKLKRCSSQHPGFQQYVAQVSPWFYLLNHHRDCRTYHHKTVVEIFTQVCRELGFFAYDVSKVSHRGHQTLEYCVQYNESTFTFLSRLLQRAGIFYYFSFSQNNHMMVLVEQAIDLPMSLCKTAVHNTTVKQAHFYDWSTQDRLTATQVTLANHHYQNTDPIIQQSVTTTLAQPYIDGVDEFERFIFAGDFVTLAEAHAHAKQTLHAEIAQAKTGHAQGNYPLHAGQQFRLTAHSDREQCGRYLLTKVTHHAFDHTHLNAAKQDKSVLGQCYRNAVDFVAMTIGIMPALTLPKPKISGIQRAQVVGIEANTAYTDQYARVKVQFPWDRYSRQNSQTHLGPWIRVASPQAHSGFGLQFMPRVGSEVLIRYAEGDPEQPTVVGMAYNIEQSPPFNLPEQGFISGFKSQTVGAKGSSAGQSELSFSDQKQHEKITLHAARNLTVSARGDMRIAVQGQATHTIKGRQTTTVHDEIHIEMAQGLILKAGGSHIKLSSKCIEIQGGQINLGELGTATTLTPKVPVYVPISLQNAKHLG